MSDTQKQKFQSRGARNETVALPEYPKIPDEIKNYSPALKPHWEKFEEDLHEFFRRQVQRGF